MSMNRFLSTSRLSLNTVGCGGKSVRLICVLQTGRDKGNPVETARKMIPFARKEQELLLQIVNLRLEEIQAEEDALLRRRAAAAGRSKTAAKKARNNRTLSVKKLCLISSFRGIFPQFFDKSKKLAEESEELFKLLSANPA